MNYVRYFISRSILLNVIMRHDMDYNKRLTLLCDDIAKGKDSKYVFSPIIEIQNHIYSNIIRDGTLAIIWAIVSVIFSINAMMHNNWSMMAYFTFVTILILYLFISRVTISISLGSGYYYIMLKLISSHTLSPISNDNDYNKLDYNIIMDIIEAHRDSTDE